MTSNIATTTTTNNLAPAVPESDVSFAIVEMKGHTRMGARIKQTDRWGLRALRVEVLGEEPAPLAVQHIPPSSVHRITLCTEEQARRVVPVEAVPAEMGEVGPGGLPWRFLAFARQVSAIVEQEHGDGALPGIVADIEAFVVAAKVALERGDEDAVAAMGPKLAALAYALDQHSPAPF